MRWTGIGVAVALVAGVGCAQESDGEVFAALPAGYEATPDFVAGAVDRSASEAFRYEASMSMGIDAGGHGLDLDTPFLTGAQDGDLTQMRIDFNSLLESIADQLGDDADVPSELAELAADDLSMEIVSNGEQMYMRSPYLVALADLMPSGDDLGPVGDLADTFADLGGRWARVDVSRMSDVLPSELSDAMTQGAGTDPREILDLIANTDEVTELGPSEIDGVAVTGLATSVTMDDLFEAQGLDPRATFGEVDGTDELFDMTSSLTFPIEVWVDADGLIRRVDFTLDLDALTDAANAAGEDLELDEDDSFSAGFMIDFFDYGDESIDIQLPDDDETLDVTETLTDLYAELTD